MARDSRSSPPSSADPVTNLRSPALGTTALEAPLQGPLSFTSSTHHPTLLASTPSRPHILNRFSLQVSQCLNPSTTTIIALNLNLQPRFASHPVVTKTPPS